MFELVASEALLAELEGALAYQKLRRRISEDDARTLFEWLRQSGTLVPDSDTGAPVRSADPGDDYLISLAASQHAFLVSGGRDLLALADEVPVLTPAEFRSRLTPEAQG